MTKGADMALARRRLLDGRPRTLSTAMRGVLMLLDRQQAAATDAAAAVDGPTARRLERERDLRVEEHAQRVVRVLRLVLILTLILKLILIRHR